jgi:hypothetical protein
MTAAHARAISDLARRHEDQRMDLLERQMQEILSLAGECPEVANLLYRCGHAAC